MERYVSVLLGLGLLLLLLLAISGCSPSRPKTPQRQLAADIYAQLALSYMASGHIVLAEQRLNKAIEPNPNGVLRLKPAKQWRTLRDTQALEVE